MPSQRTYTEVPIESSQIKNLKIPSTAGWKDTGVSLKKGEEFFVEASGRWSGGLGWDSGPNGKIGLDGGRVFPANPAGTALIGRVGTGNMFTVGEQYYGKASVSGNLKLRINDVDKWAFDNTGALDVKVYTSEQQNKKAITQLSTLPPVTSIANQPGTRVALVIGNSSYQDSPLKNPVNDARDIGQLLKRLGFDVILELDADRKKIITSIKSFGKKLQNADVGLFYFAGHGVQVKGINYLIPVNATINAESDIEFEGVNANRILAKMEDADNDVNLVILDACRNNPFARSFRSASRGLARMDAPKGSFVVFATAPGATAADGDGRNGVFTSHFLKNMTVQNLKIEEVMKRVRNGVLKETNSQQIPWQSSSLTGDFYFVYEGNNQ
jgi:hypothetical protein